MKMEMYKDVYYMMARLHCMSKAFVGIVQGFDRFGQKSVRSTTGISIVAVLIRLDVW